MGDWSVPLYLLALPCWSPVNRLRAGACFGKLEALAGLAGSQASDLDGAVLGKAGCVEMQTSQPASQPTDNISCMFRHFSLLTSRKI